MARLTNADRKALAAARAGEVSPEVEVKKEAAPAPAPVVDDTPKPAVVKPARTVKKKVAAKVEEPKVEEKNADLLGEDEVLEDKTVAELRDIASDIDVEGRSNLKKKADLIEGIKSDDDWEK